MSGDAQSPLGTCSTMAVLVGPRAPHGHPETAFTCWQPTAKDPAVPVSARSMRLPLAPGRVGVQAPLSIDGQAEQAALAVVDDTLDGSHDSRRAIRDQLEDAPGGALADKGDVVDEGDRPRGDVRHHRSGIKGFHHPLVGDLVIAYESLDLPADPGLSLVTYMPRDDADRTALERLAALSATRQRATTMAAVAGAGED